MDDLTVELEGKLDYTVLRLAGPLSMRSVPLAADLGSAWVAVQQRPDRVRIHRQFAPVPVESSRVRAAVRDAAGAWQMSDDLQELAVLVTNELVTNELVTNAIEHAGTRCAMSLELARSSLGIRVRDYFPARLPRCRPPDPTAMRGRGLHLVGAFASSWGVERQPDGKTVWARLPVSCADGMHQPCTDPQRG